MSSQTLNPVAKSSALNSHGSFGKLAFEYCKLRLPLKVLKSQAGFYIGTEDLGPCSRESREYFPKRELAEDALATGSWTQRNEP